MEYLKGILYILIIAQIVFIGSIAIDNIDGNITCTIGSSCSLVQTSEYSKIFGIDVSFIGLAGFIGLLTLLILSDNKIIPYKLFLVAAYLGTAFAIYFISLQIFILNEICIDCMIADTVTIAISLIATYHYKIKKRR